MKQCRNNVFETNSSSVHTISISKDGLEPSKLQMNENSEIVVELGRFTDYGKLVTQEEKLSYLITCMYYVEPTIVRDYDYCPWYDCVKDAICEYADAEDIVITNVDDAYIDRQSAPNFASDIIIDIYDKDSVIDFVFNKYVALKISRD